MLPETYVVRQVFWYGLLSLESVYRMIDVEYPRQFTLVQRMGIVNQVLQSGWVHHSDNLLTSVD